MDQQKLDRANILSNFIRSNEEVIYRYVNDMTINDNAIGRALIDINKYAPQEAVDIKNAIKKALENIKKEFDERFGSNVHIID